MSRSSVRAGVATILAGLTYNAKPLYKSVWPVMPTFVDQKETPVGFVMIPRQNDQRRGMQRKLVEYSVQIHSWFTAASVGWSDPSPNTNLMVAPTGDPQMLFDAWLEVIFDGLRSNKSFAQNVPPPTPSGRVVQTIELGEPTITTMLSWPERDVESEWIICASVIETTAKEQILGV